MLFKARVVGAGLASLPGLTLCDWGDALDTAAAEREHDPSQSAWGRIMIMRYRGHVYHRLVLVLVVVLLVHGSSGHLVVGWLWLESGRSRGVKGVGWRVCQYTVLGICEGGDWAATCASWMIAGGSAHPQILEEKRGRTLIGGRLVSLTSCLALGGPDHF